MLSTMTKDIIFRVVLFLTIGFVIISFGFLQHANSDNTHVPGVEMSPSKILRLMELVADWQLANFSSDPYWINAVFATGVMALYRTGSPQTHQKYLQAMLDYAKNNDWKPGPDFRNANSLAIGQLYAELFFKFNDHDMISNFKQRVDKIMRQPMPGHVDWWWCDALFMAPPALARLSVATNTSKYLMYMDKQWWDSANYLYSSQHKLFYRDAKYFNKTEKNGQKVFWSRGNGWVLAAIARVLQFMDKTSPIREKYIKMYLEIAQEIASIQQMDGFWRTSLLDPEANPGGETSGTALFCYALSWGLNEKLLNGDVYVKVVMQAWNALTSAVEANGKLGWVQKPGEAPGPVSAKDSYPYGAGGFLLAGSEMYKLIGKL